MDQFVQTNDLQQAIENVANGSKPANSDAQFGIPPMPPTNSNAPVDMMFTMAPTPTGAPEMPKVEPLAPVEEGPSAEEILSQSLTTNSATNVDDASAPVADTTENSGVPAVEVAETTAEESTHVAEETAPAEDLNDVKQNILKELLPLLDKTEKTAEEKWDIYKQALGTMHDVKTVEGAYHAAAGISDEAKKADALFELMKSI